MAAITWYMTSSLVSVHQEMSETDPGTEAFASPVVGWVVGTGSTNRSAMFAQTERASSTFVDTTPPDGSIDTTNGDCLRSTNPYTGDFASGNWTVTLGVRSNTGGETQDGVVYCRLFRSTNADGSGATEITGAQQGPSTSATNVNLSVTRTPTITFNPGAFSLSNEYLFVQIAWERTGAGPMATSDVNIRIGNASGAGTRVVSADFTPPAVVPSIPFRSGRVFGATVEPLIASPKFFPFPYFEQPPPPASPAIPLLRAQLIGDALPYPTQQPRIPFPFFQEAAPPEVFAFVPVVVVRPLDIERKPTSSGFAAFPFFARTTPLVAIVQTSFVRDPVRDSVRGGFSPFPYFASEPPPPANPLVSITSVRAPVTPAPHVVARFSPFPYFQQSAPDQFALVPIVRVQPSLAPTRHVESKFSPFPFFARSSQLVPITIVRFDLSTSRHVVGGFVSFPFSPPAPESTPQHIPIVRSPLVQFERAFVQPQPIAFPYFQQPAGGEQFALVPMQVVQSPRVAELIVQQVVFARPLFYFVVGPPTAGDGYASHEPIEVARATVTPIVAECSVSVVTTPTASK